MQIFQSHEVQSILPSNKFTGHSHKASHNLQHWRSVHQWEFQDPKMEVPSIYKAYFSGLCKGISPPNMAKHMVLTYLHFRILEFPLSSCLPNYHYTYHGACCEVTTLWLSHHEFNGHATGSDLLEVPTICKLYKAYLRLCTWICPQNIDLYGTSSIDYSRISMDYLVICPL